MRHQKLDVGTALVGLAAVGLLVSLFLDWYSPSLSAWDAFEFLDWLLAACAAAALFGCAVSVTSTPPSWLPYVAVGALFVAASQLIDPPPAAHGASREVGAWIGCGCALLMTVGVALAAASIAITVDVRGRERRRRVAAVDRRDAEPEPAPGLFTDPTAQADPQRTETLRPIEREDAEAP